MTIQAATLKDVVRYGATFASQAALNNGANETVLAPASNVSGVIVWRAGIETSHSSAGGSTIIGLLAKSSAPGSGIDGDVLLSAQARVATAAGIVAAPNGFMETPVFVAAGKGLYFRNSGGAAEGDGYRFVQYTLL